uniref:Uncharacterized protein n=1 Tax=Anopheles atroparvus TaxID=41427 RepID=A0A182IKE1_ANOAO
MIFFQADLEINIRRRVAARMSHEYGRSSVCVRSWISRLYDLVNWRLQNLQMNCFLGRWPLPAGASPAAVAPLGASTVDGLQPTELLLTVVVMVVEVEEAMTLALMLLAVASVFILSAVICWWKAALSRRLG